MLPWIANSSEEVSSAQPLRLSSAPAVPPLPQGSACPHTLLPGMEEGVPNKKSRSWHKIFRYLVWISPAPILKFTAHIALPVRGVGFLIRGTTAKWHFSQEQLGFCLWEGRALISEDKSECPQQCLPSPVYQSSLSGGDRCTASKWKRIMSWGVQLAAALPLFLHTLPAKLLTEWLCLVDKSHCDHSPRWQIPPLQEAMG